MMRVAGGSERGAMTLSTGDCGDCREGFLPLNLATVEFQPGLSPSHGVRVAKQGVTYTRSHCLLKMRAASAPLHPPHPHTVAAACSTVKGKQDRADAVRKRALISPPHQAQRTVSLI